MRIHVPGVTYKIHIVILLVLDHHQFKINEIQSGIQLIKLSMIIAPNKMGFLLKHSLKTGKITTRKQED